MFIVSIFYDYRSAYEEGKFCETFHMDASGWRSCESCGKQIHCGCIVSFHMFVLLDAGGIECISCTRKSFILTPNPAWPPPSLFLPLLPERIKDLSSKTWGPVAGSGSGSVPWQQVASMIGSSSVQSESRLRMPFEVDISSGIDRLINNSERLSSVEKKKVEDLSERSSNGSLKIGASEILDSGNTGTNFLELSNSSVNVTKKSSFLKSEIPVSHLSSSLSSACPEEANDQTKVSGNHAPRSNSLLIGKQTCNHGGSDSLGEAQTCNGRPRGDARAWNQLLPRYWPRITDQELQQICGDSNSVITPLFEKMLSASDAGKIGRLVLPKKCAEAYFPPISQPEGLPLKVQDLKGKEWIFQFRFWPNNNSRMYVLEGVTPCMQSMQLQAGDTVTFSRIEPEGKLVMGFRKASTAPPNNQIGETVNACSGISTNGDVSTRKTKPDRASACSKEKLRYMAKEGVGAKSSYSSMRKNGSTVLKSKRLRIENGDLIEVKLTWEQAQMLLRPPPNHVPSVVLIEGFEFEEYEDAPSLGRPTIFATDCMGENIQWAQCEDCFKWRKVPVNAFLSSRWTCSENLWDSERSLCSAAEELTAEQLEDLLSSSNQAASKKMKTTKQEPDSNNSLEGLDALANLAIQAEGEALPTSSSSSQATTKHPRHRPGCTCIVCIQPPSGKGPKHKQTCTCNVCLTVKRRFHTLMLRREEKKQYGREAETTGRLKSQDHQWPDDDVQLFTNSVNFINLDDDDNDNDDDDNDNDDGIKRTRPSVSPFKGQIDLNIQPDHDDELSPPGSDSSSMMRLTRLSGNSLEDNFRSNMAFSSSHCDGEVAECLMPSSRDAPEASSTHR
ncbi:hypothetical protein NMG60_11014769 [Bertholletia excelsa]